MMNRDFIFNANFYQCMKPKCFWMILISLC
jgi:hypothetical protein